MRRLIFLSLVVGAAISVGVAYSAFSSTSSVPSSSFSSSGTFCTNVRTDTYSTSIADTGAELDKVLPSGGGTATTMQILANGTKSKRILVAFGSGSAPWTYTTSSLGHNCSVTSATLTLYETSGTAGRTLGAYDATGSWNESTQYQYGSGGNAPGQSGRGATTTSVASGTITFTSRVSSRASTRAHRARNGFWVEDVNEGTGSSIAQNIATRENSTASQRPQLSITYGG